VSVTILEQQQSAHAFSSLYSAMCSTAEVVVINWSVDQAELLPEPMGLRDYGACITGEEGVLSQSSIPPSLSLSLPPTLFIIPIIWDLGKEGGDSALRVVILLSLRVWLKWEADAWDRHLKGACYPCNGLASLILAMA